MCDKCGGLARQFAASTRLNEKINSGDARVRHDAQGGVLRENVRLKVAKDSAS